MTDAELLQSCHIVLPGHSAPTPARLFAAMAAWCEQNEVAHDVYGSGALVEDFERKIAALLGFEAAVFCISGTMAQVTALRLACEDRASRLVALPNWPSATASGCSAAPRTAPWPTPASSSCTSATIC